MKEIHKLIEESFSEEAMNVKPVPVDEEAIREKTFQKLGLSAPDSQARFRQAGGLDEEAMAPAVEKKRSPGKILLLLSAAAACALFLFGVTSFLGENPPELLPTASGTASEESLSPAVSPAPSASPGPGDGLLDYTVRKAVLEGNDLCLSLQIKTDQIDLAADTTQWYYSLTLNGEELSEYQGDSLDTFRRWEAFGEDTYHNEDIVIPLPESVTASLTGKVSAVLNLTITDLSRGEDLLWQIFPKLEFTLDCGRRDVDLSQAEQNGVRMLSFSADPEKTAAVLSVPAEVGISTPSTGAYEIDAQLFRENGENILSHINMVDPYELSPERVKLTAEFEGIPQGDEKTVLTLMEYEGAPGCVGRVVAEFTIDLEQGTASPSERWKDRNDPLYWNEEAALSPNRVFPCYRAPDSELENLKDGYRVEFLSFMDGLHEPLLNLVTDQPYRELYVQLLREDGTVLCAAVTEQTQDFSEDYFNPPNRVMFQPFEDYDFSYYNSFLNQENNASEEELARYRELFGEQRISYTSGGEIPREMEKTGLNSQTVFLRWIGYLPPAGEKFQIRLADSETGEELHRETVEMAIPENVSLKEGETLVKVRGPYMPYIIVNEE